MQLVGRLISWNGQRIATMDDFDPSTGDLKIKKDNKSSNTIILDQNQTQDILNWMTSPDTEFIIDGIDKKKIFRHPHTAFTTSTLQQDCSIQLKLSPSETMAIAQSLYENSLITYMRTDSSLLGSHAIDIALQTLRKKYSEEYLHSTSTNKKQVNSQDAHEAIRPTTKVIVFSDGSKQEIFVEPNDTGLFGLEKQVYELIYQRTLASVMAPAVYETLAYTMKGKTKSVTSTSNEGIFKANQKQLLFPGYQILSASQPTSPSSVASSPAQQQSQQGPKVGEKIFLSLEKTEHNSSSLNGEDDEEDEEQEQEQAQEVEDINTSMKTVPGIVISSHKTAPPLRYTEASFIRELESAGVGRPSTYASIIQTLEDRGYILVDKRTIIPTVKGIVVSNLLSKHFPEIILPEFTSEMESSLDLIAHGVLDKTAYLRTFYLGNENTSAASSSSSSTGNTRTAEIRTGKGLKSQAIEVNNNKQNYSSSDYKILEIKNLKRFGRLFYTGDEELILEKTTTNTTNTNTNNIEEQEETSTSVDVDRVLEIKRWKLPISGDIRKLNEEYLEETIQKRACEKKDYLPSICPPTNTRLPNHGQWIGEWKNKQIMLKQGMYGPYLDYDGTFW
jgi:DNA topoisomerase I